MFSRRITSFGLDTPDIENVNIVPDYCFVESYMMYLHNEPESLVEELLQYSSGSSITRTLSNV